MQPVFAGELREFRNPAGKVLKAEIVSATSEMVTLKLADGREITTKIAVFSKEDQEYISEWLTKNPAQMNYRLEAKFKADRLEREQTKTSSVKTTLEKWAYEVTLANTDPTDLSDLKVEYQLFKTPAGVMRTTSGQQQSGEHLVTVGETVLAKLEGRNDATFTTAAVEVKSYEPIVKGSSGSVGKDMEEDLEGAWIRVYHQDKMVFEAKSSDSKLRDAVWLESAKKSAKD